MTDIKEKFEKLFENRMSEEEAKEFLLALKLDESLSVEAIAAGAEVMRQHSVKLPIREDLREKAIDVVGTGGDKIGSFNISTTTSIISASAGSIVAKHGNRSITSKSGSADVLEALGVNLNLSVEQNAKLLEESGWCFMFAINHHPAMKYIMPIRKSLNEKTVFNILGPLTNPANVKKSLLGVFSPTYIEKMAEAMMLNGAKDVLVVSSKEGMDEISISDVTYAVHIKEGSKKEFEIVPENYGLKRYPLESIKGEGAKENATIMTDIFKNQAECPKKEIVLLNVGATLMVDGMARDIKDGVDIAKEVIESEKALKKLNEIIEISNKL